MSETWTTMSELPAEVVAVLGTPAAMENPIALIATTDADGSPRTAPFGSVRALDSGRLRFGCGREHATFVNIVRDGRVSVSLLYPRQIAISARGRARVVKEQMQTLGDAVVEIEVEEVKNDAVSGTEFEITSGVAIAYPESMAPVLDRYLREIEQA
jgi:predicted pyridoxine 5'-phosphate oxidase superfamily flavin-nucleotide-binding protein